MKYSKYIDHTLLKAEATPKQIIALCKEAHLYDFASVCVNSGYVALARRERDRDRADYKICTVVGFPLGAMSTKAKLEETKIALKDGAEEVDMVINIGLLKAGNYEAVENEIAVLKKACKKNVLKVIIEACLLTPEEIVKVCELAKSAGADYVKTSTGFSTGGAKVEDVALMRKTVGPEMGVKASGGIHTHEQMVALINAGASRIGASKGKALLEPKGEESPSNPDSY